ncbi:MAG: biopolymer transporter ExbD [Bacteroidota bacterium]
MADVDTGGGGDKKHKGGPKQKKKSTRIDMTAMVDVAFLLLTFFILTSTLATPKAMELIKPPKTDDDSNEQKVVEDKVMTFILGADDKIHCVHKITDPDIETVDFSDEGLRKVIDDHLNRFPNRCSEVGDAPGCWDPIFVIKPAITCKYKNMVDIMDEMRINNIPKYALDEVNSQDSLLMVDNNLK